MAKKKKRKLSIKKTAKILLPLIIIIIILINIKNIITFCQSKITGYKIETIETFHELNIYDDVKHHTYSNSLEKIINTEYYNQDYLKEYLDITYHDRSNFLENINNLLKLGYNAKDINTIYDKLTNESITSLTENSYLKDITTALNLNYFHENNLNRYLKYSQTKELNTEDLITYVNIGLDNDYYTNVIKIENPDDITVIVNKYHSLNSNYVPDDLEAISSKYNKGANNKLRTVAKTNFEKMCEAALKDDITIYSGSAYRSYYYQLNLYNRYVNQDGKIAADTYSARAGYSEHQTGLATDILNKKIDYIQSDDKEYTWLINNSYKYGFILRYPENKETITGYVYEPWHYRYVGSEIAKIIHEKDITYDEYIARMN